MKGGFFNDCKKNKQGLSRFVVGGYGNFCRGGYLPSGSITAEAAETAESYSYDSYDSEYDITEDSVTISSAGTYRVYGNSTETSNTITVSGSDDIVVVLDNVVISSPDYYPLKLSNSGTTTLVLSGKNSLTATTIQRSAVYKDTTGSLIIGAYGGDDSAGSLSASGNKFAAGIGGAYLNTSECSNITINSGTITATGGSYGAGIGGGSGSGSNITINGGIVTATGGMYGAGIGGGSGSGSNITINGGTVTATGGMYGAGIGGGYGGSGSNITISGGTVTATGGTNGAGIGSGYNSSGSNIMIYNSSVKASSISVTPTNADGESVYLYTIPDTTEGCCLIVDGETYIESISYHTSSDTNQYIYLTPNSAAAQTGIYIYSLSYSESDGTSVALTDSLTELEISNAAYLRHFADAVNNGYTYIDATVSADIDMTGIDWTPIGTSSNPYAGTFDGQGHIIKNLTYNNSSQSYAGLFGMTANATAIKNVGVVGDITGYSYVGGICGYIDSWDTISNCYFEGSVSGDSRVGGICGMSYGTVQNCYNSGTVYGIYTNIGGISGYTGGTIRNCYNTGSLSSNSGSSAVIGGIIGTNSYGTTENNYYLEGTASKGTGSGTDTSASFTSAQLSSGELTWLLSGEAERTDWLQTIGSDNYPVLSVFSSESLPVVKLTRKDNGSEVYGNVISSGISVIDNGSALSGIAVDTTAYGGSGAAYLDEVGAVVDGTFYTLNNYYYIDENGDETDSSNSAYFPVLGESEKTDASVRGAVVTKETADSTDVLYFVTSATTGLTINATE